MTGARNTNKVTAVAKTMATIVLRLMPQRVVAEGVKFYS
jgi:hypothetical protein